MKKKIGFDEAYNIIQDSVSQTDIEMMPLYKSAGRISAQDIYSKLDCPAQDVSLKDGYALLSADISKAYAENKIRLKNIGSLYAGQSIENIERVTTGKTIRVTSGAPVPIGADAVLAEEFCDIEGDFINCFNNAGPGRNILRQGTDVRIGELIIKKGERFIPPALGLLAAAGLHEAPVYKIPKIAVLAMGDEIIAPGEPLPEGKIYASNLVEICSWLESYKMPYLIDYLGDSKKEIQNSIEKFLPDVDAFVTSGGAWKSERDFIMDVLEDLKWNGIFHRVRMGPGKAIGFGLLDEKPFFCLPGGPPSNEMAFLQLVLPGLLSMMGIVKPVFPLINAKLTKDVGGQIDWTQFIHARIIKEGNNILVEPAKLESRLKSMARKEAIIIIPEGVESINKGDEIEVQITGSSDLHENISGLCSEKGHTAPPVLSIVGKSDSGKTTLLEKIIPVLIEKGHRVGTIKHDAHSFDVDHEGKDSWRHREAGSKAVAISSPKRLFVTINVDKELTLSKIQSDYLSHTCDIIITEGFKRERAPKIEVNRAERSKDLICTPEKDLLIAVATDQDLDLSVPVFDINDAGSIAGFIIKTFLS